MMTISCEIRALKSRPLRSDRNPKAPMEVFGLPKIASLDYLPAEVMLSYSENVDMTCNKDAYHSISKEAMDPYFDPDNLFNRPVINAQMSSNHASKTQQDFSLALPATGASAINNDAHQLPMFNTSNFGLFNQYPFGFAYDPGPMESNDSAYFSPNTHPTSRTPSLCGDAPQEAYSPAISPHMTKEESTGSPGSLTDHTTTKRPVRKRGRPRLEQSSTNSKSTTPSSRSQRSGRLPHNQVERKYREGLNSELERLRKAVPSLPQCDAGGGMGQPKPSKAMVLSSAIEYIRQVESERDALKEENGRLKQSQGSGARPRQASSAQNRNWKDDRSLDEFLLDA